MNDFVVIFILKHFIKFLDTRHQCSASNDSSSCSNSLHIGNTNTSLHKCWEIFSQNTNKGNNSLILRSVHWEEHVHETNFVSGIALHQCLSRLVKWLDWSCQQNYPEKALFSWSFANQTVRWWWFRRQASKYQVEEQGVQASSKYCGYYCKISLTPLSSPT